MAKAIEKLKAMAKARSSAQALKKWAESGGDVPLNYKGREHVWAKKVKKFAEGGEAQMQAGGIAKLAKLLKGTQETLPAAERQANLAKFIEPSKVQQRLYHGTTATEGGKKQEAIRRFKPSKEGALGSGVYMTPKPTYAGEYTSGAGGNMLPVYAQIKNPLVIEGKGDPMIEALIKLGIDENKAVSMVERAYENKGYIGKEVESRARAAGYDGLMQYRDGDLSEVVSYNPNAVKSAIGNKGTYDTNKPDLNEAAGGAVHMQAGGIARLLNAGKGAKKTPPAAETKIIQAPTVVVPSKLSNVKEAVRQSKGDYGARRVERAADEIPNLERMYKEEGLRSAFTGDNAQALMTMNPADFEKFALPLVKSKGARGPMSSSGEVDKYTLPTDEYVQYLQGLRGGFSDVPFLGINKEEYGLPLKPFISGHEGRHRSRALAQSGQPTSLVRLVPRAELREPFPRRTQEEYIQALRDELDLTGNLVMPEGGAGSAVVLPDIYAKGGEVRMKKGGEPVDPRFRTAGGDPLNEFVPPRYRSAGRRPESQQDREASKNVPVAVARGLVSGSLGLPADLLNLPGAIYSGVTGKESYELPFGSEYIEKRLPFRGASQTPVGELFTGSGQLAGGFYTGPGSGARAAMAVPKAIKRAVQDFAMASTEGVPRMFIGPKAKTWDRAKADAAARLEQEGRDPVDIWRQTGTFRGADGIQRQEISDVGAIYRNPTDLKELGKQKKQEALDLQQRMVTPMGQKDMFPKALTEARKPAREQVKRLKEEADELGRFSDVRGQSAKFVLEHPELYRAYPELADINVLQGGRGVGNERASLIGGKNDMEMEVTQSGLRQNPRSSMLHEMQHAVQTLEDMAPGGLPRMAFQDPKAFEILKDLRAKASTPMSFDEYAERYSHLANKEAGYQDYLKSIPGIVKGMDRELQSQAAMEYYKRLAGEAEARATQTREGMTASQRAQDFPYGSYDVLPEDLIVKPVKESGIQAQIDFDQLKSGGIEVPSAGFSKEDKVKLRPLYNQGLIRVEEIGGKKMIVPGRGAWYEFATPEQRTTLDSLQRSDGVRDLTLMGPTESLLNSAQASFFDFEIVPGVRNVPIKNLEPLLPGYDSPNEMRRIQDLSDQIKESKQIEPLFIGVDPTGSQYIMEGQHRIRALKALGYDEVPARIVVDMDDIEKASGGEVKMAGGGLSKVAIEAMSKLKGMRKEFVDNAAEQARYKKETAHISTKDLPSFEEWKAQQINVTPENIEQLRKETGNRAGGEVKMQAGGAAGMIKNLLKGAQKAEKVEHPLVFPRAEPKTREQIRPIAQRVSEQMTGEFVRQNPKVTTNPAGKSRKQFERERNIPLETRNVVPERTAPVLDYEKFKDYAIVGVPGDPSMGGVAKAGSLSESAKPTVELTRVGDITPDSPVPLFGGPRFGDDEKFWASNIGAAKPIQTNVTELSELYDSPVLGKYIKMAPDSANFAIHNLDSLLAIQRPERLSPGKMEQLNKVIREGSPKYGKFPNFPGFDDPVDVLLQSQLNSKLRKHIAETLTKPTITDELGLPNGLDVVTAITHPELRNLETGVSGFSVGRMQPGAALRAGESSHPTYDTDIPGAMIGRSKYPTPYEIAFPDTTAYARSQLKPGVQEFNMMKLLGPRERIDQQYIDEMKMFEELMKQYTGKKKGGAVGGLSAVEKV